MNKSILLPALFALLLAACGSNPAAQITLMPIKISATPSLESTPTPTIVPTLEITSVPTLRPTETFAATPTEAAPHVTVGLPPEGQAPVDVGSMDNLIAATEYYNSLPPVIASDHVAYIQPGEYPDVSLVQIPCDSSVCKVIFTARIGEKYYAYDQVGTKNGPRNLLLYLGFPLDGGDAKYGQLYIDRMQEKYYNIHVISRIKTPDYDNPEAKRLTVGKDDPLPPKFQSLNGGIIEPELATEPVWALITLD